jgi:hypothetical protein
MKSSGIPKDHQFDRRKSDVNWDGLNRRVAILEEWRETFTHDFNTLTNEVQSSGRLVEDIHGKSEEMYEIFNATRNGFRMIAAIGNFGLRVITAVGKYAKPLFWTFALVAAALAWYKTGHFSWPDWTPKE